MSLLAPEVYVVSGNLISAAPSVASPTVLDDMLDTNLLCQLAADKKFGSRFIDPAAWLDFYRTSLGKVFWKISNSHTVSYPVPPLIRSVSVMGILEQTFFKGLDRDLRHQLEADIELLMEQPITSPGSLLFNAKTHVQLIKGVRSSFDEPCESVITLQISVAHDDTAVSVCSIYFKTAEPVGNDMFNQRFKVRELLGNISVSSFDANLLEASYEGIRQQIKDKLGAANIRENIWLIADSPIALQGTPHAGARQFLEALDL